MDNIKSVLTREELTVFTLRALYSEYGYSQYKMSKFEEYELYMRNKDFLVSDNIITFNDTDGRLLALKPDVTLSIIKNNKDNPDGLLKAQYNEHVYRISGSTQSFAELMQVGLECIGKVGENEIVETLFLAKESLDLICEDNILAISQLDILEALMEHFSLSREARRSLLKNLEAKNSSGIYEAMLSEALSENDASLLSSLADIYGSPASVLPRLDSFRVSDKANAAINSLVNITDMLKDRGVSRIFIDFSLVGDMKYYNGIAFKGFIEGIPESVISGGQYDRLIERMGRRSKAIGFAVYLDELERLPKEKSLIGGEK